MHYYYKYLYRQFIKIECNFYLLFILDIICKNFIIDRKIIKIMDSIFH